MNKKKRLQEKFNHTLQVFVNKTEQIKQNQEQVLADFVQTQNQENQELTQLSESTKSAEETIAVVQNALNLVTEQLQVRDKANKILKEEAKITQEAVKSLLEAQQKYVQGIHYEIDKWNEQVKEHQVQQKRQQETEAQEAERKKKNFWIISGIVWLLSVVLTAIICYFVWGGKK